jgi:hypothetical protein
VSSDYIGDVAADIRSRLDTAIIPPHADKLLRLYALLALVVGEAVSARNVHDAWCVWMREQNAGHAALVPFDQLDPAVQRQDEPFAVAIRASAIAIPSPISARIESALFHAIDESDSAQIEQRFEQYKIMVESSERLVARRQGVNTFFLTANGAIITAIGILVQASGVAYLRAVAIVALAVAAILISIAWSLLIRSFGQLNTGKFAVINRIERRLPLGLFSAEWEALERGENPKVYRSFTEREGWIPKLLVFVYIVVLIAAILVAFVEYDRSTQPATPPATTPAGPATTTTG